MAFRLKIIAIVLFASVLSVSLLYMASSKSEIDNSFQRKFSANRPRQAWTLELPNRHLRIAGVSIYNVFITDDSNPYRILVLNLKSGDTTSYQLSINENLSHNENVITVDSPYFFIADRFNRILLRGDFKSGHASKYVIDSTYFNEAIPISDVSLAVRGITRQNNYIWAKESLIPPYLTFHPEILEKQAEGIFSTDGFMLHSRQTHMLVFVYFYRNEFIALDSNLNVVQRHHTIDTSSTANIGSTTIESENTISAASPLTVTNKDGYAFGDMLYINSSLMASNETPDNFRNNTVIDTYSIHSGNYQGSFYIPSHKNQKVRDFGCNDRFVVTIQGTFVCVYNYSK